MQIIFPLTAQPYFLVCKIGYGALLETFGTTTCPAETVSVCPLTFEVIHDFATIAEHRSKSATSSLSISLLVVLYCECLEVVNGS
jgi:hypothetical protein